MKQKSISLLILAIAAISNEACKPAIRTSGYITYGSPISFSPPTVHNPWLCYITTTNLICQATQPVRYRRGQREAFFDIGSQLCWKNPQGTNSRGLIYYGCPSENPCDGIHVLVSQNAKVEACDSNTTFLIGNDFEVPVNAVGIIEVGINNNQFNVIVDRFTGLFAPQILKTSQNVILACNIDECSVINQ